jgi:3-(3-hydroxy-phenyl)propionate hydroxylase
MGFATSPCRRRFAAIAAQVASSARLTVPHYDVAIIGYGPVGAVLANLLGAQGHSVLIVDQMREIHDKPRAINIDHEVMRVLQSVGLADAVNALTIPYAGTDFLGLDGQPIKVFEPSSPPYPLHWAPNLLFIQPEFEPILRGGVDRFVNAEVLLEHRAVEVWQTATSAGVRLVAADGKVRSASARYLVACDGAASPVRKQLGIGQESLDFDEWWTVVDAWLMRPTPLPRRTTQYCWPSGPTTYVVGPRNLRRWEMKLLPGEAPQDYEDRAAVRRRLAPFVDPDAIEIWRVATYRFHALVAQQWRCGRIFLAGDAAHQMPPFMAQGLCSGIRDAANLAWKLSEVLKGDLPESLLSTYESERRPHIRELVAVTKRLGTVIGELDVAAARRRDREMAETLASEQTTKLRQSLIPRLAAGIVAKDRTGQPIAGSGELFPQPRVRAPEGRSALLDDLCGDGFVLMLRREDYGADLDDEASRILNRLGVTVLALGDVASSGEVLDVVVDEVGVLESWMTALGLAAALVRPDKYVFGGAPTRQQLSELVHALGAALFTQGADPPAAAAKHNTFTKR